MLFRIRHEMIMILQDTSHNNEEMIIDKVCAKK